MMLAMMCTVIIVVVMMISMFLMYVRLYVACVLCSVLFSCECCHHLLDRLLMLFAMSGIVPVLFVVCDPANG